MKKLAIFCALVSILVCYLEWGGGNHSFIYEAEYLILFQKAGDTDALAHPAVLIPLLGQLLLLFSLFQKAPNKRLVFAGLTLMGLLVLLLLLVGILSRNWKIILSTLPFLVFSFWCIRLFRS